MALLRRRTTTTLLSLLAVFILGTVIVISSVSYYLAIDSNAFLTELEVPVSGRERVKNGTSEEHVPRILHQTYKSDRLPKAWEESSKGCRAMMPDYQYMFWTDETSRELIKTHFSWFLTTFDGYKYNIQRADAVRYFILYHFGGVYLDLDVQCMKPIDSLLAYDVVLPRTRPVGISNDVMFAEKGHSFFAQTIHNLVTFDHSWILNYPTVIFSTGPMFLSAQYGLYTASHPESEIRVLPTSMYGKYCKGDEGKDAFFKFNHQVGGTWHGSDANFVHFLHCHGMKLLYAGIFLVIVGCLRMASTSQRRRRTIAGYEVVLPRWNSRGHIDMGWFSLPVSTSSTQPPSPTTSDEDSSRPPSPDSASRKRRGIGAWIQANVLNVTAPRPPLPRRSGSGGSRSRGVMYFLPAIFTEGSAGPSLEMAASSANPRSPHRRLDKRFREKASADEEDEEDDSAPPYASWN